MTHTGPITETQGPLFVGVVYSVELALHPLTEPGIRTIREIAELIASVVLEDHKIVGYVIVPREVIEAMVDVGSLSVYNDVATSEV